METNTFWKTVIFTYIITVTAVFSQEQGEAAAKPKPIIKSLHIDSDVKYLYAKTLVSSRILNPADIAQEVSFRVTLPEDAFITKFVMEIKGKSYEAYIKGKEEAKQDYDAAVSAGIGAAHVFQDPRNSKEFSVAVNVEAEDKVNFNLTYEELLSRKNRTYKNEINVSPNQLVNDLSITVTIEDVLNISKLEVPKFKMNNEIDVIEEENPSVKKTFLAANKVVVEWTPTMEEQKDMNKEGLNGQMVVKYDVDTSQDPQQILMDSDGYFLQIFRNDVLPTLLKHVVFVLDVSGSMAGDKIHQLKDAMKKILSDMTEKDSFSIVLFSVPVVAYEHTKGANLELLNGYSDLEPANIIALPGHVIDATKSNVEEAITFINTLNVYGGTNIMGGLRNGLKLAKLGQKMHENSAEPRESMLIFLTDGQPNSEESNPDKIVENFVKDNNGVTCFSLAFGFDADTKFLKKLSLTNNGFSRTIYTDSDASQQLQNFYKEIASPVLSGVKFEYKEEVENTTSNNFKNLFSGSELLVLGRAKCQSCLSGALVANTTKGIQRFEIPIDKIVILPPEPEKNRTYGRLEKMWAYKTIKTLLNKNTVSENDTIKEKAKDLALKYSFVTELTSLVVVKPNDTSLVNDQDSNKRGTPFYGAPGGFPGSYQLSAMAFPAGPGAGFGAGGFSGGGGGGGGGGGAGPPPSFARPSMIVGGNTDSLQILTTPATLPHPSLAPTVSTNYTFMDLSDVKWLNQTVSEDGSFLLPPPSLQTTDVIALNETDISTSTCADGNKCRHFKFCVMPVFIDDMSEFEKHRCHIDPNYIGVCCPA